MIAPLTPNTQAILLLTAPLEVGRNASSADLLTLGEYNRLARLLRQGQRQPADLLGPDAAAVIRLCAPTFEESRLKGLLGRGFLLSQAVERWHGRAIWVISRADANYPSRLKSRLKEDAPPVLYGCGEPALLEAGGFAVVGSRHVDEALLDYTAKVGQLIARSGRSLVSGGARGIDQAAMRGASQAGGPIVGVLADSLERAALAREHREGLMDGRLVLISPYDPAAGFNVGHAMQRNKAIYALADAALVVSSDFNKGGTWAGAVEQLEKYQCGPVFVRQGKEAGKGNDALLRKGALPWTEPEDEAALAQSLESARNAAVTSGSQGALPLTLGEERAAYGETAEALAGVKDEFKAAPIPAVSGNGKAVPRATSRSAEELRTLAHDLLCKELVTGRTEEETAACLGIHKAQAKAWLQELVKAGALEKMKKSKPARFRTVAKADTLL
jgi:DNA processing protein